MVKSEERVTPSVSAALASFGAARLKVSRKPRLALLSTGTELVEVESGQAHRRSQFKHLFACGLRRGVRR